jgi:tetratricopeptide (TPR) repeat protein
LSLSETAFMSTETAPSGVDIQVGPGSLSQRLKRVWQVPALAAGVIVLATGLVGAFWTKPRLDPAAPLKQAGELLTAGKTEEAVAQLNDHVLPLAEQGVLSDPQLVEMHLLRARAVSLSQGESGVRTAANDTTIAGEYREVEKLGGALTGDDQARVIEAEIALGSFGDAAGRLGKLTGDQASERRRLTRVLIQAVLDRPDAPAEDVGRAAALLDQMLRDELASPEARAWALLKHAELTLAAGNAERAIDELLRESPALMAQTPRTRGRLLALLGRAYFDAGDEQAAERQLRLADETLDDGDPARADLRLALGRIAESGGSLGDAREHYGAVVEDFPESPRVGEAKFGLARIDGGLGDDQQAVVQFSEIVGALKAAKVEAQGDGRGAAREHEPKPMRGVGIAGVSRALMSLHADRSGASQEKAALVYAQMAETLYSEQEVPAEILLALAKTHLKLADSGLKAAWEANPSMRSIAEMPEGTRIEAKSNLLSAAGYFRRHAKAVQGSNPQASTDSLWAAADCADRGGDLDEAIKAFREYAESAAEDDPRKPEAKFRLAQAFQARKDFTAAEGLYEELKAKRKGAGAAGPWGDRSLVPLAMCYLRDADDENDASAEKLLLEVMSGQTVTPRAEEFRDALGALARLYYHQGRHEEAISRLTEAIERYPEDKQARGWTFMLADSYRLSAAELNKALSESIPQARRAELENDRIKRLDMADANFERVRAALEGVPAERQTALEKVWLRNAYLYLGDVAFDRGDDELAVRRYDAARQAYPTDPASMIAMMQIVSSYARRGEWAKAATANERAKEQLAKLPKDAFDAPDLPMSRQHWERWLEATTQIELEKAHASVGEAKGGSD